MIPSLWSWGKPLIPICPVCIFWKGGVTWWSSCENVVLYSCREVVGYFWTQICVLIWGLFLWLPCLKFPLQRKFRHSHSFKFPSSLLLKNLLTLPVANGIWPRRQWVVLTFKTFFGTFIISLTTGSIPRHPIFLRAISFEWTKTF